MRIKVVNKHEIYYYRAMQRYNHNFPWGHEKRYNTFVDHQRKIYGERVQKVTVDAGFTCPNRDGTLAKGGCIYCNNESFNPAYNDSRKSIRQQIDEGVEFLNRRYTHVKKFIVYFSNMVSHFLAVFRSFIFNNILFF